MNASLSKPAIPQNLSPDEVKR
jgi:Ca2+-binding EF-hand superfamily protein